MTCVDTWSIRIIQKEEFWRFGHNQWLRSSPKSIQSPALWVYNLWKFQLSMGFFVLEISCFHWFIQGSLHAPLVWSFWTTLKSDSKTVCGNTVEIMTSIKQHNKEHDWFCCCECVLKWHHWCCILKWRNNSQDILWILLSPTWYNTKSSLLLLPIFIRDRGHG